MNHNFLTQSEMTTTAGGAIHGVCQDTVAIPSFSNARKRQSC